MTPKTFSYDTEASANAVDISPDLNSVVVAGRNILKIYAIDDEAAKFRECVNFRTGRHLNLNYSSNDVAWNKVDETLLATASTNGAVIIWSVESGKLDRVLQDHSRTVNKVSFSHTDPNLLLSGSQDAFCKLWDLRQPGQFASVTFASSHESVRDVQFSPHGGGQSAFASVAENGRVSIWDVRRYDRPEKSWLAHAENVFTCDWHPEVGKTTRRSRVSSSS